MFNVDDIKGLTNDSRQVKPGFLFAAIKGEQADGFDYIPQALEKGATHILSDRDFDAPAGVIFIQDNNPRSKLAELAAAFYGRGPDHIVAVTGTNGKSSVVEFTKQIWQGQGYKAASLGTIDNSLTTPDPVELHKKLADLRIEGVTHLALEASSHGLEQHRLDGVDISAAGFTSFSQDHLDYHASMEDYFGAKAMLFANLLAPEGHAILNADIEQFDVLKHLTTGTVISYGKNAHHIKIVSHKPVQHGAQVEIEIFNKAYSFLLPLIGAFQLYNALCALGLSFTGQRPSDEFIESAVSTLVKLKPAKGRLQSVPGHPQGAAIYIDYAHTPDALETMLKAIRPHVEGRLVCLFGCGGDRDKTKRPLMGEAAANHSDIVILTDDNPRNENPVDIRKDALVGISSIMHNETVFEIGDRAAAINHSVKLLTQHDTLVIAGKGHEQGQILGNQTLPFDDFEEALKALQGL